jgi:hypothetical protein
MNITIMISFRNVYTIGVLTFLLRRMEVLKSSRHEVVDHVRQFLGQFVFLH